MDCVIYRTKQYNLTEEKLRIRMNVWEAISIFYLDTELDSKDYDHILHVLSNSQIALEELKLIDLHEVFPTLQTNLAITPGVWTAFEPVWLKEKCLSNYKKRMSSKSFRIKNEMKNKMYFGNRREHWDALSKRLKE